MVVLHIFPPPDIFFPTIPGQLFFPTIQTNLQACLPIHPSIHGDHARVGRMNPFTVPQILEHTHPSEETRKKKKKIEFFLVIIQPNPDLIPIKG